MKIDISMKEIPVEMRQRVYEFLTKNKKDFNDNKFDYLFKEYHNHWSSPIFLSLFLYACDIDPLPYFKSEVPNYFLFISMDTAFVVKTDKLVVPNNITTIGDGAFQNIQTPEIYLPHSIKRIGERSFSGINYRTTKTADIYYDGTSEEWNEINRNGSSTRFTIHTKDTTLYNKYINE